LKLAAFDLDNTLIYSDRGEPYPLNGFVYAYPNSIVTLQQYAAAGFTLVIFSNRRGGSGFILNALKRRIERIAADLQVPLWAYIAVGSRKDDFFRKPNPGMFQLFLHTLNRTAVDPASFYCGDAAGPMARDRWFSWSDTDLKFAQHCGLQFYVPSQILQPWSPPMVPDDVRLIITIGQNGSGWDMYQPGAIYTYNHRIMEVIESPEQVKLPDPATSPDPVESPDEAKSRDPGKIYLLRGSHPTRGEREAILTQLQLPASAVTYLYFARPSYDRKLSSKLYSSTLNLPPDYIRMN
jgi:DNA 3'-phosphatase